MYLLYTKTLTRDVGSILVGQEAVREGLIDETGGIREALSHLHMMIENKK